MCCIQLVSAVGCTSICSPPISLWSICLSTAKRGTENGRWGIGKCCCPEPVVVWSPCLSSAATERRICHQRVEKDLLSVILALQRTPVCNRTGFCSACPVAHSSLTHLSEAEGKFPFSGGLLHLSSVQHAYFGHGICKTQPGTHKLPVLLHPLQPPTAILRFQSRVRESVARCW